MCQRIALPMRAIATLAVILLAVSCPAQELKRSIPYIENGHARHVLDIYTPTNEKNLPVVF